MLWAVVQRHSQWVGGDPNPGTAFLVDDSGNYEVRPGYYLYRQVTRAGQPKLAVASASSGDNRSRQNVIDESFRRLLNN